MGHLFLAVFLIVFGANMLFGLRIPVWVHGVLAIVAGLMLLMERFNVRLQRKP